MFINQRATAFEMFLIPELRTIQINRSQFLQNKKLDPFP